jgi:hypothetical protein
MECQPLHFLIERLEILIDKWLGTLSFSGGFGPGVDLLRVLAIFPSKYSSMGWHHKSEASSENPRNPCWK